MEYKFARGRILDNTSADGQGTALNVRDCRHVKAYITASTIASNAPNFTVKCQTGWGTTAPNFAATASKTNQWDYAELLLKDTDTSIDGSTGLALTSAHARHYVLNEDYVEWINFIISGYDDGVCTVDVYGRSN
jgi:hypothetical protein